MLLKDGRLIDGVAPMPTHDVTQSSENVAITGETVTWADGAAGTTQQIKLVNDGIMNATGAHIGKDGDTSITWTTGTVLTTEVEWKFKGHHSLDNDTDRLATLANGYYMVDYENGYILGKNAITTSTATDTIAYKIRLRTVTISSGGSTGATDVEGVTAKNAPVTEKPVMLGMEFEALGAITTDGGTAGDKVPWKSAATGIPYVTLADAAGAADLGASINTLLGTIDADTGAIKLAVEIMDDWDNAASDGASVSGDTAHDAVDAGEPVKIGGRARTSQIAAVANNDRTDAIFNAHGEKVMAGYDWASGTIRTTEADPISDHHVEETLINATNITTNTTTYAYFDMDGFKNFSLQGETSGAAPTDVLTVTVEGTNQDDGTAPASCVYQDVTNALFTVASAVDTDFFWLCDTQCAFKFIRVKYVTSNGGGGDADLTVYIKKMY